MEKVQKVSKETPMSPLCSSCRGPSDNGTNYCNECYTPWVHKSSGTSIAKELGEMIIALELNKITQEAIRCQTALKYS